MNSLHCHILKSKDKLIDQKKFNPGFLDGRSNFSTTLVKDYSISNMYVLKPLATRRINYECFLKNVKKKLTSTNSLTIGDSLKKIKMDAITDQLLIWKKLIWKNCSG